MKLSQARLETETKQAASLHRGAVADPNTFWVRNLHPFVRVRGDVGEPKLAGSKGGGRYGRWQPGGAGLAYYHGGPSRPHLYGFNFPNGPGDDTLGQWAEIIGAAASAYGGGGGGAPGGGPSAGGPTTGMPMPGSTATAVSPTFQTAISPQISPTFQQTQDSPGAVQAATATQYQPGGMFAEGGSAAAAPPVSPYGPSFPDFGSTGPTKYGGLPVSPLDPVHLTDIREFPSAADEIARIRDSEPFNWTPVYVIGGLAVVGGIAFALMNQRRRK